MNPSQYPAPSFLAPFVSYDHPTAFEKMIDIEWRGQIQSSTQNKKFKIKYYGELFEEYQLITGTDFAPELIYVHILIQMGTWWRVILDTDSSSNWTVISGIKLFGKIQFINMNLNHNDNDKI